MKIFTILLIGLMSVFSTQCGSVEEAAALKNYLESLQLADCVETSDEGYVPESAEATDEEADEEALEECKESLVELYDTDGDGEISETEGEELEIEIESRKQARVAACSDEGITDEQACLDHRKAQRKLLRETAIVACLIDFDADSDGTLSKTEIKACHDARKAERKEIRQDFRCQGDANECGPLKADKLKEIAKDRQKARKEFLEENAPDGVIADKTEAAKKLKDKRVAKAEERAPRKAANETKVNSGKTARQQRGRARGDNQAN